MEALLLLFSRPRDKRAGEATSRIFRFITFPLTWVESGEARGGTLDAAYSPGQRGLWLKTKCLHREEFVVIGWTDPEGSRPFIGALLLAYYDPDGRLIYAGRVGSGMGYRFSVPTVIGQCW
jgi:hypothetical protein